MTPTLCGPHVRPFPRREPKGSLGVGFRPRWRKEPWNETSTENIKMKKFLFAILAVLALSFTVTAKEACKCTDCGGQCCPCDCAAGCC